MATPTGADASDDFETMKSWSTRQFIEQSDDRVFQFANVRPHYLQCAEMISSVALACDQHDCGDTDMLGVHMRVRALALLENWLCNVTDAVYNRETELTHIECKIKRTMALDCSSEYIRSHPLSREDAFMCAATCLMIVMKHDVDEGSLCARSEDGTSASHALRNYVALYHSRGFYCSPFFAYAFLNDAARRMLYPECRTSAHKNMFDGVATAALYRTKRAASQLEFEILSRVRWRVHFVTDTHFIAPLCDNVDTFIRDVRPKMSDAAVRAIVTKLRVFAYVYVATARAKTLAGFAGGISQCWLNALCAVLVSLQDTVKDRCLITKVCRRMYKAHVPHKDDASFMTLKRRRLYESLREYMLPILEKCSSDTTCRKRAARPLRSAARTKCQRT